MLQHFFVDTRHVATFFFQVTQHVTTCCNFFFKSLDMSSNFFSHRHILTQHVVSGCKLTACLSRHAGMTLSPFGGLRGLARGILGGFVRTLKTRQKPFRDSKKPSKTPPKPGFGPKNPPKLGCVY